MGHCLLLPGFADSAEEAGLRSLADRLAASGWRVTRSDWPGLWSRAGESAVTFAGQVREATRFAQEHPGSVLIGHSLGGRVALLAAQGAAAVGTAPALVVGLAAAVGPAPLSEAEVQWRREGMKRSFRTDPVSGSSKEIRVPLEFLDELRAEEQPVADSAPVCLVAFADDQSGSAGPVAANKWAARQTTRITVTTLPGRHRYWDDPASLATVTDMVASTVGRASN